MFEPAAIDDGKADDFAVAFGDPGFLAVDDAAEVKFRVSSSVCRRGR